MCRGFHFRTNYCRWLDNQEVTGDDLDAVISTEEPDYAIRLRWELVFGQRKREEKHLLVIRVVPSSILTKSLFL